MSENINYGELSEAINDKMDRDLNNRSDDSGLRKLVDSYVNGTDGYKIFDEIQSDGTIKKWCEQWGRFYNNASVANTVNLYVQFINTDYMVFVDRGVNGTYNNNINGQHAGEPYDFTVTNFKVNTYASTGLNIIQWKASGYIS